MSIAASQATQASPSRQLRLALILLWTAWGISVFGCLNHIAARAGGALDLYARMGLPGIMLQAVALAFLARRNNAARVALLLAAVPGFIIVLLYFRQQIAPLRLATETLMRVTALGILLMPSVASSFKNRVAAP